MIRTSKKQHEGNSDTEPEMMTSNHFRRPWALMIEAADLIPSVRIDNAELIRSVRIGAVGLMHLFIPFSQDKCR